MKLILDISRMLPILKTGHYSGTGIDRVLLAYIAHYLGNARAFIRYGGINRIYSKKDSIRLFNYILRTAENSQTIKPSLIIKLIMFRRNHHGIDKSIFLHLEQCAHNFTLIKQLNIPIVYMIHDLIPLHYSEYCNKNNIEKHVRFLNNSINHGAGIIANSASTLNDFRAYYADKHKSLPPTLAAPLASSLPRNISPEPRPIQQPYFVMISTIEGRKNHLLLLHIWRRLVERYSINTPKLVLIGKRGWKCGQVIDLLDHCEQIRPFIIEESGCSDEKLVTYLHHTQALLFPTFTEGYGLPLIEALSYATPVIASDIPVFHEIAGEIPEYIDPLDALKWMEVIEAYSKPYSPMRSAQLERLHSFQVPTWKDHFEKVDAFLQKIFENQPINIL